MTFLRKLFAATFRTAHGSDGKAARPQLKQENIETLKANFDVVGWNADEPVDLRATKDKVSHA